MPGLNHALVLDALASPILVLDESLGIVHANPSAARLLRRPIADLIGQPLARLVSAEALAGFSNRVSTSGTVRSELVSSTPFQCSIVNAEGARSLIEWTLAPVPTGNGAGPGLTVATLREVAELTDAAARPSPARGLLATAKAAAQRGAWQDRTAWLNSVAQTLINDFQAALCRIWLLRANGQGELNLVAASADPAVVPDARSPAAEDSQARPSPLVATVLQRRELMVTSSSGTGPAVEACLLAAGTVAVGLPLICGGEILGVLEVMAPRPWSADDLAALVALAAIVATTSNDQELRERARLARAEADRQQEQLRAILEVLPVGVAVVEGPERRVRLINSACLALSGEGSRDEINTLAALDEAIPLVDLDGRPTLREERPIWRTLFLGERIQETRACRTHDGRELMLEIATAPLPGPVAGAVATFRNVTEENRLRSELAERAAQFKALLDHLPVGVAYFNVAGVCQAANGPARKLLGQTRASLTGTTAETLFGRSPALRNGLARCFRDRMPHVEAGAPWTDPTSSIGIRYLDWRFEPLPSVPGRSAGALALIVDVTERKLAADGLRHAAEAAEAASRYKTQFLTAVSHDLRTPVNALSLQAEWLSVVAARQVNPDPELSSTVADLRRASANLIDLVNDLLELTLFDSGVIEYHVTEFPLQEWLDATLAPLRTTAQAKGLTLTWRTDRPGRYLRADRVKLARVLLNLAGNAVKFTETGRVEVEAGRGPGGFLRLVVRDTGPGIPEDQRERIFDEFAQLRNPERDRTKGTGLGLAICRRLVTGAGGRLEVASRVGVGSTFVVEYPPEHLIEPPTPLSDAALSTADATLPAGRARGRILIVEDDPYSRRSLAKLLERSGYRVEAVESGAAALEIIRRRRPALVLLDLMMPGMDGCQVLRLIRTLADRETLPVIVLTGDVLGGRSSELQLLNVNSILAKPLDFNELYRAIRVWVEPEPNSDR